MHSIKLLRHWHKSTSTEVSEGDWVQITDLTKMPLNELNCSYIIKKIDTERLEVVVKPNLLNNLDTFAIKHSDLTDNYSFFQEL